MGSIFFLRAEFPVITEFRDISKVSLEDFAKFFFSTNLDEIYYQEDLNVALETMNHKILKTLDNLAPIKRSRKWTRARVGWLSRDLREQIGLRQTLRKIAVQSGKADDWEYFKIFRNHSGQTFRGYVAECSHKRPRSVMADLVD